MITRRTKPSLSAYQKARLQAVAYRSIQTRLSDVLSKHDINISQWIILGWLRNHPDGLRVTALAEILNVETPLITTLIGPLQKKELVISGADIKDKRAKLLKLTADGEVLVADLEDELAALMSFDGHGFKKSDVDTYYSFLQRLTTNDDNQKH